MILVGAAFASGAALPVGNADAAAGATAGKITACSRVLGSASVAGPTNSVAWKVGVQSRIGVFDRLPGKSLHPSAWVAPTDAPWLLVLARPHKSFNRCWVQVRLPWRPNVAAGWVNANLVAVEETPWRIEVSTARRTLTLFRAGRSVRTISVVVGKPSTPTPTGLFAIAWAIPWHPNDFLGSWVLELTAHSDVLQQFDGGDGTVGIHGRGGASLLDPLGSAASHGCIRLANDSIDWLVHTVRPGQLPGTPVQVS
ncbi:MAG TPA: L,D-transpeptidase family protein [Solirubrobacteraceae bacterium]|nr:L,D-transpeptidase family protein [Solirubrobacteraceae bacterium]